MKMITELNETNFDETLTSAATPMVVDFYAPWCGPCKMIAPLLDQLAQHYAGRIQFFKVNVDEAPDLAARLAITGVPTLLLLEHDTVLDTIVGLLPPRELEARLEALATTQAGHESLKS